MDFFRIIPSEFKESSYFGIIITVVFMTVGGLLFLNELSAYLSPKVETEIFVDHLKDDKDLLVNIDIILFSYPCGLVSLDKLDAVHTHTMDVTEGLIKNRIDSNQKFIKRHNEIDTNDFNSKINLLVEQVNNKEGCQLVGTFGVKLVPGNFHISFHNYSQEFRYLMDRGLYQPDFSHKIVHLSFGEQPKRARSITDDFGQNRLNSLNGSYFPNLFEELGFPHSVAHILNIIPSKFQYQSGETYELYQYTSTSLKQSQGLQVIFQFNIENFYMLYKFGETSFSHFAIQTMSILGGLYMLLSIIKLFIEDGLISTIYKRRIGKLD